jgi:copper(I)-binding protein
VTSRFLFALCLCVLAAACSAPEGPPLTISKVVVLEALPGTKMSVAYLTLDNNSDQPIVIDSVTSPQFASVDMHETVIENDVARMASLTSLVIESLSSVRFETGGKHLMMSGPLNQVEAGLPVTIEIHYDSSGLLIVATTVSSRNNFPDSSR